MDGVFDLFHIGHLNAIQECAKLGDKVIIGITGQEDATGYKRAPIIPEAERVAIVSAIKSVDCVICPCPLVVTKEFMEEYGIDLVVHGFASDKDEKRQYNFFEYPIKCNTFQKIPYYEKTSTTDIINKIKDIHL
jgi:cytidyltransferase-like protein